MSDDPRPYVQGLIDGINSCIMHLDEDRDYEAIVSLGEMLAQYLIEKDDKELGNFIRFVIEHPDLKDNNE